MIGRNIHSQRGFTLLEATISMMMVAIIIIATVELFSSNILSLALGRSRAAGIALANEKMEYLRDLPYDSLSTQHGDIYPAGNILDDETVTRNNIKFRIHTDISYVDDPYDGNLDGTIAGKPQDFYPYDYKKAEITIYTINGNNKVARLTSNISAKAAETSSNTGIIRVKVLNASGQPVEDASVHITNSTVTPAVDITTDTDSTGYVVIPKMPPDSGHDYKIVVTKNGYSTDQTYPSAGTQVPVLINPTVLAQQISDVTFSIDTPGNLTLNIVDTNGNPIPNLAGITISGAKKTYTNPDVYKFSQSKTADGGGQILLSNLEWDSYSITLPSGYYAASSSPYQPIALSPGGNITATIVATTSSTWPRITTVSPTSDNMGSPTTIVVKGTNFTSGTTLKLVKAGQPDIAATGVIISGANTITGNLDITTAATGSWDIVVTNGVGTARASGGFNVLP